MAQTRDRLGLTRVPSAATAELSSLSRRPSSGSLSPAVTRRNDRVARLNSSLQMGGAARVGSTASRSKSSAASAPDPVAWREGRRTTEQGEFFLGNITAVEGLLQGVLRGVRMEQNGDDDAEGDQTQDEAARRRLEAERMRAWRKEKQARDPKRKLEQKLENSREFKARPPPGSKKIPMMNVTVSNEASTDQVSLVNVPVLQNLCIGMGEAAPNVSKLMAIQSRSERQKMLFEEVAAKKAIRVASSAGDEEEFRLETVAEQIHKVRSQREVHQFDSMLRKLSCMRGSPSDSMLERFEVLAKKVSQRTDWLDIVYHIGEDKASRHDAFMSSTSLQHTESFGLTRELVAAISVARLPRLAIADEERRQRELLAALGGGGSSKEIRRALVLKRWRAIRGVTRTLTVYFAHMRRRKAAEVIKHFIGLLDFTTVMVQKMRYGITRVNHKIIFVQQRFKGYLTNRQQRLNELTMRWELVEDGYLQHYFANLQRKEEQDDERRSSKAQPKAVPRPGQEKKGDELKSKFYYDWRLYRMPETERAEVLARYYMVKLWQQSHNDRIQLLPEPLTVEQREVRNNCDLLGILPESKIDSRKFWYAPEAALVDMIAECARSHRNVFPWKDHPANKDPQHGNPLAQRLFLKDGCSHDLAVLTVSAAGGKLAAMGLTGASPEEATLRTSTKQVQSIELPKHGKRVDMDDVFDRFTPGWHSDEGGEIDIEAVAGEYAEGSQTDEASSVHYGGAQSVEFRGLTQLSPQLTHGELQAAKHHLSRRVVNAAPRETDPV